MKHLGGGLSHTEIWELPVPVRKFYVKMMVADVKRDNDAVEAAAKKSPKHPKIPKMSNFKNTKK
tara:strand:+ start:2237 stop:2428 length:192 start_codon:yes stop_codon:yes gene_type:complete